jgi:ubiquitin-protein ligase
MRRFIRRQLQTLEANGLPFRYSLSFVQEVEVGDTIVCEETPTYNGGHVMCVDMFVAKDVVVGLQHDYQHFVFIEFPDDYPFSPPTICLDEDEVIMHPLIDDDNIVRMWDYSLFMDISQLLINVYLIIAEALNYEQNADVVESWNERCVAKTIREKHNDDDDGDGVEQ